MKYLVYEDVLRKVTIPKYNMSITIEPVWDDAGVRTYRVIYADPTSDITIYINGSAPYYLSCGAPLDGYIAKFSSLDEAAETAHKLLPKAIKTRNEANEFYGMNW